MTFQQLIIVGHVGRDPEFKYTSDGVPVCTFSVAVSKVTGRGEQRSQKTTWFRVTLWRDRAETASQLVKKGQRILLVGEVSASAYIARDGQPVASLEITASEFRLLSARGEAADSETDDVAAHAASGEAGSSAAAEEILEEDAGELPF
jgi:single-strand DNA-binding protein